MALRSAGVDVRQAPRGKMGLLEYSVSRQWHKEIVPAGAKSPKPQQKREK
jgi:hypothetical protein